MPNPKPDGFWRKRILKALIGLSLILAALIVHPVSITFTRLLILLLWPTCVGLLLAVLWGRKAVRWAGLAVCALFCLFMTLPGRAVPPNEIRNMYVGGLKSFAGSRYVWGGENGLGIDCSGLVRIAMVNTHARLGLTTLNPGETRKALDLWWHDASAKFMRDGYGDRLRSLGEAPNINSLDPSRLLPGDLAATMNGVHVMAYLGDSTWIEAEPDAGRTIVLAAPVNDHPWFKVPVRLLRWACFE